MKTLHPLAPFVRTYFEDHLSCRRNLSRHTIHSYRDALKLFLGFAAEEVKRPATLLAVEEIHEQTVLAFLVSLEQVRGNSIQTRNHRLCALRGLFDYIGAREPLLLEHCRRIVTIPKKRGAVLPQIQYLEKAQISVILDAVPPQGALAHRDYALLLFMYNTGARVQEVADTRVSWITWTGSPKVSLLGKGQKWRSCPLWDNTIQHLKRLIEGRPSSTTAPDWLFVNRDHQPLSRSGIADIVHRYAVKAASVEPSLLSLHVTPHTLRHTTAMHLLQSGVDVNVIRSWLGHASISTTNHYIEIDLAMKARALQACEIGSHPPAQAQWRSNPDILSWLDSL